MEEIKQIQDPSTMSIEDLFKKPYYDEIVDRILKKLKIKYYKENFYMKIKKERKNKTKATNLLSKKSNLGHIFKSMI